MARSCPRPQTRQQALTDADHLALLHAIWIDQTAPARNQLAERFGIARETAARAHAWLARDGYLVAVPGVGMVVTPANRWPEAN
jgi:DNA-binding transcriptional regulator YhcF (GntR family)